jgi:hypothetical protein
MPFQASKPIVLSGSAVVCLENTAGFDAINVKQSSSERSRIPLTIEQQDVGMLDNLSGEVPFLTNAKENNAVLLMKDKASFRNMSMQPPEIIQEKVPACKHPRLFSRCV